MRLLSSRWTVKSIGEVLDVSYLDEVLKVSQDLVFIDAQVMILVTLEEVLWGHHLEIGC